MVLPSMEHIELEGGGSQNQPRDCAHLEAQGRPERGSEEEREAVEEGGGDTQK